MKFLNWILEARRGGTPKVSVIEALKKYKNDPDIYISYTSLEKLGINPQYDYGTPLGIYFYPLKEVWKQVENNNVPFGGERNWVWVVKAKNLLDLDTYTESDFWNDGVKITKNINFYNDNFIDSQEYIAAKRDSRGNPGRLLWYFTHNIAKIIGDETKTPFNWTKILRKGLGYKGVRDTKAIIHNNEPQQAIIFSLRDLQVVEKIRNINPDDTERIVAKNLIEYLEMVKNKSTISIESIIQNRITKTWANKELIVIKDNAFQKMSIKDFKYILSLDAVEGITILKLIKDSGYKEDFIKAAVDSKTIILIDDIDTGVFYLKEFHIFNWIQSYLEYDKKKGKIYISGTWALINIPKVIESLNVKKYLKFMEGLIKDRILNVYDIFSVVTLVLDLKGNKKEAVGFVIGQIYPKYIQVEAAKKHPETMDKVIDLFKRDVLNKAPLRGFPPLNSLEKYIDKKYIEKYW